MGVKLRFSCGTQPLLKLVGFVFNWFSCGLGWVVSGSIRFGLGFFAKLTGSYLFAPIILFDLFSL